MQQLQHPWFGLTQSQQRKVSHEFKQWLAANRSIALKHGATRDDGKVFCSYQCGYANGEHWTTPENFARQLERCRNVQRKNRRDPEFKQKFNAYIRKRQSERPDLRAKRDARVARHRLEKPEMNRAITMRRYARKRDQVHSGHSRKRELELFAVASILTRLTGQEYQVDHIIPIAAGGWHHHDNMQVMPMRLNTSKNDNPYWLAPSRLYRDWRNVPVELWPSHLAPAYEERLYDLTLSDN